MVGVRSNKVLRGHGGEIATPVATMNYTTRQKQQYSAEINKTVLVAGKFEFEKARTRVRRKVALLYYIVPVPVGTSGSLSITREALHM